MDGRQQEFELFLQQRRGVAAAYVEGDVLPLAGISTRTDPATLFGPGGGIEQGAAHVLEVNEASARHFAPGARNALDVLHAWTSGDLGYWVGIQRATVNLRDKPAPVEMALRVTEIFRREDGVWKLAHRHADMLVAKQAAGK